MGDFNHPSINWELLTGNGHATDFLDALGENFLTQHVTFPTHDGGHTLDLVISNIPGRIGTVSEGGKLGNSDHCIILTEIMGSISTQAPLHTVWNFKYAKFENMKNVLREIQWNDILINDMETDWNAFKSILTTLCDQFIPKKQSKKKSNPHG